MKYTNLLAGGLLALTASACFSPRPILQLEPTAEPSSWFYGHEVLTRKADSVRVSLIFERWVDGQIVFATEVINRSSDTVLVSPETFFYEAFLADSISHVGRALDPEREILEIRKAIAREQADRRNAFVFDVALAATTVAVAAVTSANSDEGYYDDGGSYGVYFSSVDTDDDLFFLNQLRYQWQYQALRKTSLPPGQVMRGSVVFLDQPDAWQYIVYVPIGERLLPFDYRKRIIQP